MINRYYQLISPKAVAVRLMDEEAAGKVVIRPEYMAVCHADQRYYQGLRPPEVLRRKLPMALIHEACGRVIDAGDSEFRPGQKVVMIPNTPVSDDPEIYENYRKGSYFLASGHDGFMREVALMDPGRVVALPEDVPMSTAAITEFLSVCAHAADRFLSTAHSHRDVIGIWGDGSLSYCLSVVLRRLAPGSKICVVGRQPEKLSMFSFVDERRLDSELEAGFGVDHAFECAGGEGSAFAIDDIIRCVNPQGNVMLMGVSENKVPVNTRDVLEKGLTFIGCSRSGRENFETVTGMLSDPGVVNRLERIITLGGEVRDVDGIHRVFAEDLTTPFKTVFRWGM